MSEVQADPGITHSHEVWPRCQPGMGLSTSVPEKLTLLVLGDAREAVEVAKRAHSRGHLLVLGVQSSKVETRDAKIPEE